LLKNCFIYDESARIPTCHAPAAVELANGDVLCAWFGGEYEGANGSSHYCSVFNRDFGSWSVPELLSDMPGRGAGNPRLIFDINGILWAILPVNDGEWCNGGTKFYYRTSADNGRTWSKLVHEEKLDHLLGKNKPLLLDDGRILIPTTHEMTKESIPLFLFPDTAEWHQAAPITIPGEKRCIQPTFTSLSDGRLLAFLRNGTGRIWQSWSEDSGMTWREPEKTELRHNDSGIDLLRLQSGKLVLVYNDIDDKKKRTPLKLIISENNGETWSNQIVLEDKEGEFSYPAIIQAKDGLIHCVYTYIDRPRDFRGASGTHIKHVMLEESEFYV
jgi:predicted neuraminidase